MELVHRNNGSEPASYKRSPMLWTKAHLSAAKRILRQHARSQYEEALEAIGKATGRGEVTAASLRSVFIRQGFSCPTSYLKEATAEEPKKAAPAEPKANRKPTGQLPSDALKTLLVMARKGPVNFHTLCDKLDLSPAKVLRLIETAKEGGVEVHIEHNHVGVRPDEERVVSIGVPPTVGQRQRIAVISDTHLGSKYCLREQLIEFIHYAYSQGVREILHPGDVLDGCYRHGIFEVSHTGIDSQAQDLFEVLPQLPGLTYHAITGNHDYTFTELIGVDVGQYLMNYFAMRGRKDLHFHGNRGAFLRLRGAMIHLWHPKKNPGYAKSYSLQKQVEKYASGEKPNLLFTGHWHLFCYVQERGVHAFACPTFQGGGSAFSKSLGGAPAIGGLIVSWEATQDGTLRAVTLEKRDYYEVEVPQHLDEPREGIAIKGGA